MIPSEVYDISNLERSWKWLLTNPEAAYKNYFRSVYRAYALSLDDNLRDLNIRLKNGSYQPDHSTKIYLPKASGVSRPMSLLTIEDQVVYQAFANIIAEKLQRRVGRRYGKQVFGHLYEGRHNFTFYRDWRRGFKEYTEAIRSAYSKGLVYTASFDLTACYDSIDHAVLKYFLKKMRISGDVCEELCSLFTRWSSASPFAPIYHGHGISSGLIAECVLQHLDGITISKGESYCRYVDDVRLLAKTEKSLRKRLVALDQASKEVGLFPQSSKINIHRIKNIDDEIKSISNPPEPGSPGHPADQDQIHRRLFQLTARGQVQDNTRFKFVLGQAEPRAKTSHRLLRCVEHAPHLTLPVCNYLSRSESLPKRVSEECLRLLREQDLYASCTAAMLRMLQGPVHSSHGGRLYKECKKMLTLRDPELAAAAGSVLLSSNGLTWAQTKYQLLQSRNWMVRGWLIGEVNREFIGDPSFQTLMDRLVRDPVLDVAILAAEQMLATGIGPQSPRTGINRAAQAILRRGGMVRSITKANPVGDMAASVLGARARSINWKKVLGHHHKPSFTRFSRWRGYVETDPTAWVNLTDTINDLIIDRVFAHQNGLIGNYNLGKVGSVLNRRGRFARKFPKFFDAVETIHRLRLESELSHAYNRATRVATRRIEFREVKPLKTKLLNGYLEIWRTW